MKNKYLLRRITAAATAAVLAGSCVNIPVFAQQVQQDASSPASSVFEMKDYSTVTDSTEAIFNENAADFTSYGGSWKAGESVGFEDIDFSGSKYQRIMLLLSARDDQAGKTIEVRLDQPNGELISTITVKETSDDETCFYEHYGELAPVSGVHDVYFVFPEEANLNFDWFTFSTFNGTETEEEKAERMKWWDEARFGQFIHFGAYAQLAGEYPPGSGQEAPGLSEWIMSGAGISKEEYKEIAAEKFNPENFDAKEIVSLAKAAGQKYIVFTSRHHEGFSMWDTKVREFKDYSLFSVGNHGNYTGVDPILELSKECKKQGIKFGTYITVMDWHDRSQVNYGSTMDPEQKEEFIYRFKSQIRELVETYGVELLWFDGQWQSWWTKEDSQSMYEYIRTLKADIIANNRVANGYGDYDTPEQNIPETGLAGYWESCMTMTGHWGYNKFKNSYKDGNGVVDMVVQCASGGGNCLLNLGPMTDGSITEQEKAALSDAGKWMAQYGDSIYGTQANVLKGLPQGVRATVKEGKMYLHITEPITSDIQIPNLANEILSMKVMGTDQNVGYTKMKTKTLIKLSEVEQDPYDTVIEISVDGMPAPQPETNYALQATEVTASNVYYNNDTYSADKAVDGDESTRWATDDNVTEATIEMTFDQPITVNSAELSQYCSQDKNYVNAFTIDYWDGSQWVTAYQGGKISEYTAVVFNSAFTASKVRFHFTDCSCPTFWELGLYFKEINDISITSPIRMDETGNTNEGVTVLEKSPFTVSGTWKSTFPDQVETVEVHPFQDGVALESFNGTLNPDGTWSATVDQTFGNGTVKFTAYLKDKEGNILGISDEIPAIYRGHKDLAKYKTVETTSSFSGFEGAKAVDGMTGTRWAPQDSDQTPAMTVDLGQPTEFNRIIIREMFDRWNSSDYRCSSYNLEAYDGSEWTVLRTGDSIGAELILDFEEPITAQQLRLTIAGIAIGEKSWAPGIETFEVYHTEDKEPVSTTIAITDPTQSGEGSYTNEAYTLMGAVPFAISGIWDSNIPVANVEVQAAQNDAVTGTFTGDLAVNGSWSVSIDQPLEEGEVTFTAFLKDADGNVLSTSKPVTAIYRGADDLARNQPVVTSSAYTNLGLGGDQAVDGLTGTRWAPQDSDLTPMMTVNLGELTQFNRVIIREMFDRWSTSDYRCTSYTLEAYDGSAWTVIQTGDSIGEELVLDFDQPVTAQQLRLTIAGTTKDGSNLAPSIETFEVYNVNAQQPEEANKFNLKFYLDKANAVDQEVIDSLVESAKAKFTAALENGQAIYDDPAATQEEVDAAAKELRIALNMLSMVAGDKEALNDLISQAEDLIANAGTDYPQSAIDALQDAVDAAKEVANDGDAFQADVDKTVEDLQNAIEAFNNSKLDWRALEAAVSDGATIAADIEAGRYVEDEAAFEAFDTAYAAAQELLNNKVADSQEAINAATTALLEASSNLRYKADKDTLKAVIGQAEGVDVNLYTAASVANFKAALTAANTVAADETLSVDDQAVVDDATAELKEAMAALVPIDQTTADGGDNNGSNDTAVAGGEDTTDTTTATKTGDSTPWIALAVVLLAAGAGVVFRKKRS